MTESVVLSHQSFCQQLWFILPGCVKSTFILFSSTTSPFSTTQILCFFTSSSKSEAFSVFLFKEIDPVFVVKLDVTNSLFDKFKLGDDFVDKVLDNFDVEVLSFKSADKFVFKFIAEEVFWTKGFLVSVGFNFMPLVAPRARLKEELRFRALRCFEDVSIDLFFRFDEVKILGFKVAIPADEETKLKISQYYTASKVKHGIAGLGFQKSVFLPRKSGVNNGLRLSAFPVKTTSD